MSAGIIQIPEKGEDDSEDEDEALARAIAQGMHDKED